MTDKDFTFQRTLFALNDSKLIYEKSIQIKKIQLYYKWFGNPYQNTIQFLQYKYSKYPNNLISIQLKLIC